MSVFAAVAVNVVVPETVSTPDWVRAPPLVTPNVPLTVDAPKISELISVRETLLPLVTPTVLKLLPALLRVMLLATPAARVVAPVTFRMPL